MNGYYKIVYRINRTITLKNRYSDVELPKVVHARHNLF